MTLHQLRVLTAVADTGSFSKAAERVSLAQSTTSQHIKTLENELGVRLFDRSTTTVTLTAVGKLFYGHAKRILDDCNESLLAVRRFQGMEDATIVVGASTTPATCLVPELIGRLASSSPGIRLEVRQGDSREVIQMILDDDVEVGIVGGDPNQPAITFQKFMTDRIILASRPGVAPQSRLSLQDLQHLPLATRETGSGTRQTTDRILRQAGIDPQHFHIRAQLGSSEALRRVILQSDFYAFISAWAIQSELSSGALVEIPIDGFEVQRDFHLAWRSGRSLSPGAKKLIDLSVST